MEVHLPFEFGDIVFLEEHIHAGIWKPLQIVAIEVTKPNGHKISKVKVRGEGFLKEILPEELIKMEHAKAQMIEYILNYRGENLGDR